MKKFDAVIVANGIFPSHPVPLAILQNANHVVACDGAVIHVPQAEAVVGDGDSVPAEYHSRLIQVDEQEDNDLTKATRYCLAQGWHYIAYLGATGLREDHTLGNISLLMRYYREMDVIFNFGCTHLLSEGLKWNSYAYRELWQGTLNEALTDHFTLRAEGYYMVYQTYDCK